MNFTNSQSDFYAIIKFWDYIRSHLLETVLPVVLIPAFVSLFAFWQTQNASTLLLGLLGMLFFFGMQLIGLLPGVCEIKFDTQTIAYKKPYSRKYKLLDVAAISHICFFERPLARGELGPAARFYTSEKKYVQLGFLLPEKDIYQLLSLLHDLGKPVLLWEENKNIEETSHYKSH